MTHSLDLDALEAVALTAPQEHLEEAGYTVRMDGRDTHYRLKGTPGICLYLREVGFNGMTEFIATFDPPTVLALIQALRDAERRSQ